MHLKFVCPDLWLVLYIVLVRLKHVMQFKRVQHTFRKYHVSEHRQKDLVLWGMHINKCIQINTCDLAGCLVTNINAESTSLFVNYCPCTFRKSSHQQLIPYIVYYFHYSVSHGVQGRTMGSRRKWGLETGAMNTYHWITGCFWGSLTERAFNKLAHWINLTDW